MISTKNYLLKKRLQSKLKKIPTVLCKSQSPMNMADKIGLALTLTAFAIIFTPIAISDADPYHLKTSLEELQNMFIIEEIIGSPDTGDSRIITYLKISSENHLESIEKIIHGKMKPYLS